MLIVKTFVCNPFQVNSYLLHNENGDAILIDAAMSAGKEFDDLKDYISSANLRLKEIVNTHGHVDHLMGVKKLKEIYKIPFRLNKEDEFLVKDAVNHARIFGLEVDEPPLPDEYLKEGDIIKVGEDLLECISIPGHSPGSLVFYCSKDNFLIAGDVLFSGSIGRSDLPKGNHDLLIEGIRKKLFVLPDETEVFPGHGLPTTIGSEKNDNPFFS